MHEGKDIVLVVDYYAENIEYRWFDEATGQERTGGYATSRAGILRQVEQAHAALSPGGEVVWVMESTTGWARVKGLLRDRVKYILVNVLQMPLPPQGRRRKTDKIDTARILREYQGGKLPRSYQPEAWWREVRRVVDCRQDLVERQTAIKNWIGSLLHQETWEDRKNLWSGAGLERLGAMKWFESDRELVELKLRQLEQLSEQLQRVEARMRTIYEGWLEAQWVDQVRGIGMVTATSLLAHIGPIERLATAEGLIAYAGLAPGVQSSDTVPTRSSGHGTASIRRTLGLDPTFGEYAAVASQTIIGPVRAAIEV